MNDWRNQIPAWLWSWVSELSTDTPVYLVGGIVRDWIIGRSSTDLDLVIEGDAIAFAHMMQQAYGGSVVAHLRFGTAKWTTQNGEIDFVTARSETYAAPAALPTITPGSMSDDLRRRDFTINALALRLDGEHLGEIVDLFDGLSDLQAGLIRVLHEQSFVDDPTRIFRAVRYEQRLGFAIEPQTLRWLLRDKRGITLLSGDRVRHEIGYILKEPLRVAMLGRLDELGVLAEIVPHLTWNPTWAEPFERYPDVAAIWGAQVDWEMYLLLWIVQMGEWEGVFGRLNMGREGWKSAENTVKILETLQSLPSDALPSQITFALDPFRKDTAALLAAHLLTKNPQHAMWLYQYQATWRTIHAPITGKELQQMGLQPGPHFRDILDTLRGIVLDGLED